MNKEYVFFLSAEEAETYFPNDDSRIAERLNGQDWHDWWLRSPEAGNNTYAGIVGCSGEVGSNETHDLVTYTRPAFNLNLDSVLFTSPAEGGKVSGPIGKDALTVVPNTETTEWKLTLLDTSRAFSASWFWGDDIMSVGYTAWAVDIDYYEERLGDNERVSALLCKKDDGTVLYYGRLEDVSIGPVYGIGTINIPTGLAIGEYQLKLFNEQVNGDKKTDYASAFSTFDIKVDPVFVESITLDKQSTVMLTGNTVTLVATVRPEDATNQNVTWSSSDDNVATVDQNGKVTAVAPGAAIITATAEGAKENADVAEACFVTVLDAPVPAIVPGSDRVSVGNTLRYGYFEDWGGVLPSGA